MRHADAGMRYTCVREDCGWLSGGGGVKIALTTLSFLLLFPALRSPAQELTVTARAHGPCSAAWYRPDNGAGYRFTGGRPWGTVMIHQLPNGDLGGQSLRGGALDIENVFRPNKGYQWSVTYPFCTTVVDAGGTEYTLASMGCCVFLMSGGSFQAETKKDMMHIKGLLAHANKIEGPTTTEMHPPSEKDVKTVAFFKKPQDMPFGIAAVCKPADVCRSLDGQEVSINFK